MATATRSRTSTRLYIPNERLLTRKEFEKIADSGVFHPGTRLELIEGRIVKKELPMNSPHATSLTLTELEMRRIFTSNYVIRVQLPIALNLRNEPLPDVAVVTGSVRDYKDNHPTTAELIIEVLDTTLRFDRTTKASLYARASIPEYWIVNLADRVLIVHRQPAAIRGRPLGYGYESVVEYTETASISPLSIPDASLAVADLLP